MRGSAWAVTAALCGGCFNPSASGDAGSATGSDASTTGQPTSGTEATGTEATGSTCAGECGAETTIASTGGSSSEGTGETTGGAPLFEHSASHAVAGMSGMLVGQVLPDPYDDLILTSDATADFVLLLGGTPDLQLKTVAPTRAAGLYDFEGDGVTDVLLASNEGAASRLYSVTLGGEEDPVVNEGVEMGCAASSLVVTDFGENGLPDVMTACPGALQVDVFVGVGETTFVKGASILVDVDPTAIALADVVGGAEPDLVISSYGYGRVRMIRAAGPGTFLAVEGDEVALTKPGVLRVGPLDTAQGDDVLALQQDNLACVVIGGTSGLAAVMKSACGTNLVDAALGDLDDDGLRDVVTVGSKGVGDGVLTVLRNGANGIEVVETFAVAGVPRRVVFADLDNMYGDDLAVLTDVGVEVLLRLP